MIGMELRSAQVASFVAAVTLQTCRQGIGVQRLVQVEVVGIAVRDNCE
jgi:hypothetical protein